MGNEESHFNVSAGSGGQSHKTVSTNHNLFEEKGERYRTEVLPLTRLTPYRWAKPAHLSAGPVSLLRKQFGTGRRFSIYGCCHFGNVSRTKAISGSQTRGHFSIRAAPSTGTQSVPCLCPTNGRVCVPPEAVSCPTSGRGRVPPVAVSCSNCVHVRVPPVAVSCPTSGHVKSH